MRFISELRHDGGAARAETGLGIGGLGVHPAARALDAGGLGHGDLQTRILGADAGDMLLVGDVLIVGDEALGHDEQLREVHGLHALDGGLGGLVFGAQDDGGLQRLADALGAAGTFEHTVDVVAQRDEGVPNGQLIGGQGVVREGLFI